ncbi:efflux RND transporter permease subunit [Tautonia rosea]|uniref:efflux RND transporter permease subunit n=1 Tax=Tautonia rosea TaxID=2728037 RepID=UPI001474D96D|nr:MMPL family transporter [Tautonia rosea]
MIPSHDALTAIVTLPARWSLTRPRVAVVGAVLIVLLAMPGLWRLELRTDGKTLVPPDDPVARFDSEARRSFGLRDPMIVLLETRHPNGIFNSGTLEAVRSLTRAILRLEGVDPGHVSSLATELRDRVYEGKGTFQPFLDSLPGRAEEFELLRADLNAPAARPFTGTLVSEDRTAAAIFIGVPEEEPGTRSVLSHQIIDLVDGYPLPELDRVSVAGAPVAEALLGTHILEDLLLLIPATVAIIALVVWLGCRNFWGVALGLLEIGACLVTTFGVMGWIGSPIYLSTVILPVVLVTVALTDEVHLFWHYQEKLAAWDGQGSHLPLVEQTISEMARPLAVASLTTSIGFLSFLGASIGPIRMFGAYAAGGLAFCFVWSVTFIPASLAWLGPRAFTKNLREKAGIGHRLADALAPLIRRRSAILALASLLTLIAAAGMPRLRIQDSWVHNFSVSSPLRQASERVDRKLHGSHILLAHVSVDPSSSDVDPLLQPASLALLREFEEFASTQPRVGGVTGLASSLEAMAHFWDMTPAVGSPHSLPEAREARRLLTRYALIHGEDRLRALIDDRGAATILTISLKDANYQDTARLMEALQQFRPKSPSPSTLRIQFCGDVALSQAMIPAIVSSQIASLVLDLVIVSSLLVLFYRAPRFALLALLPTLLTIVMLFGFMGWSGLPLGVATSLFCVIIIGVGVDYAVYFLEGVTRARGRSESEPVSCALRESGPAIITDILALAIGFGVLTLSHVPTNARLGSLLVLGMVCCGLLTLVGLGALLHDSPKLPNHRVLQDELSSASTLQVRGEILSGES